MSQLIDNLNTIESVKTDIKAAIENKGVDMTGVSFPGYASKIGEITTSFVTETLNVSSNGTYNPGQGIDGYSQVVVDVPIDGWDQKSFTEEIITFMNIDNSASFVASSAFSNNQTIKTVNLSYATTVNQDAFRWCGSLLQISLPMCSCIGTFAFGYCNSLSQVSLPVCSRIYNYAFYSCKSLSQVSLPMCSHISDNAFNGCNSLSQVSLPVCSRIEVGGFGQCLSLTQISLPVCSYVGNQTFYNCTSLSTVYIGTSIDTVCVLYNTDAFFNCSALTSIYVPTSLVESYKAATNWTYYSDKIVGI